MADKEAERIKFETEMLKVTAALATITGGGSISLLLGTPDRIRIIWAGAGLLVTVGLLFVGWRQRRYIRGLIEQIKEQV